MSGHFFNFYFNELFQVLMLKKIVGLNNLLLLVAKVSESVGFLFSVNRLIFKQPGFILLHRDTKLKWHAG